MAFIAIFAAINYVVFSYLKIDIPLAAGSSVAIHVANAIVVVSAFLLGPVEGGGAEDVFPEILHRLSCWKSGTEAGTESC